MPRLPQKIQITILNFEKHLDENKFRKSWSYLKVDYNFLQDFIARGLSGEAIVLFQFLLLTAFRQRNARLTINTTSITGQLGLNKGQITPLLNTLFSSNFIDLEGRNIRYNKVKEGKVIKSSNLSGEEISQQLKLIRIGGDS